MPIWRAWVGAARACGRVTVYAQRSRLVIQARVRFAGAMVRAGYLDATLWLAREAEHPRLARIENFGALGYGLHFHLHSSADVDPELVELVREAYEQALRGPSARPTSVGARLVQRDGGHRTTAGRPQPRRRLPVDGR